MGFKTEPTKVWDIPEPTPLELPEPEREPDRVEAPAEREAVPVGACVAAL